MGLFDSWQKGIAAGKENRRDRIMGQYGQKALGGDQNALAQVYGVDTNAGMQLQQYGAQQAATQQQAKAAKLEQLGKFANAFVQTRDPMIWKQMHPLMVEAGAPAEMPADIADPNDLQGALQASQSFAAMYGGGKDSEQFTLAPGSARYDARGRVLASQPFAPQKPDYVLSPDGTQWLPKPMEPQQPMGGAAGTVMDNAYQGSQPFYSDVESIISPLGGALGSTNTGQHNPGSLHYSGNAVDIPMGASASPEAKANAAQIIASLTAKGYKVRDERTRPQGQAVWGGPHLHAERAPQPGGAIPIPGAIPRNGGQQGDKAANWQVIQGNDGQFYRLNKLTGQLESTAVHGNNAARIQKMEQERLEKVQGIQGALAQTDGALQSIETLLQSPGRDRAVGIGSMFPTLPGSDAATFEAQLDTLKAQTFIPMVAQLKGMGALSDAEGKKLSEAVGALSLKMGDVAFKTSLNQIKKTLSDAKTRGAQKITAINQAASSQYKGESTPSGSAQGGGLSAEEQAELDQLRAHFGRK